MISQDRTECRTEYGRPYTSLSRAMNTSEKTHRYTAALANEIEGKWQTWWEQQGTDRQPNPGDAGFDDPVAASDFAVDVTQSPIAA